MGMFEGVIMGMIEGVVRMSVRYTADRWSIYLTDERRVAEHESVYCRRCAWVGNGGAYQIVRIVTATNLIDVRQVAGLLRSASPERRSHSAWHCYTTSLHQTDDEEKHVAPHPPRFRCTSPARTTAMMRRDQIRALITTGWTDLRGCVGWLLD